MDPWTSLWQANEYSWVGDKIKQLLQWIAILVWFSWNEGREPGNGSVRSSIRVDPLPLVVHTWPTMSSPGTPCPNPEPNSIGWKHYYNNQCTLIKEWISWGRKGACVSVGVNRIVNPLELLLQLKRSLKFSRISRKENYWYLPCRHHLSTENVQKICCSLDLDLSSLLRSCDQAL